MNEYRFHVPDLVEQSAAAQIRMPDDQAHHAAAVLRLTQGAPVILFDGLGHWMAGTIASLGKREVQVCTGTLVTDPPPKPRLTLASAIPKGDRAEMLVEQASQLLVFHLQWLSCDRGVVLPREGGKKMEKWQRIAVESAKQSHRTHLLTVGEPLMLEKLLKKSGKQPVLWLDPHAGRPPHEILPADAIEITALVGPEGGWSEAEVAKLEAHPGILRIRLMPTILRIETACAAIAAVVMSK